MIRLFTSILCLLFITSTQLHAQCPSSTAGQLSGTTNAITATNTTPAPVFTTAPTGLPNTEFVVLQQDSIASDGLGPRIITSSISGEITPANWGLGQCNQFCLVPFSYDLSQIQLIVDSLLYAEYVQGTSCCTAASQFFGNLCGELTNNGINSGSDVTSLADLITIVGIFTGTTNNTISLENLISSISQLNQTLLLFGNCSGGILELCYDVDNSLDAMDCYVVGLPNAATNVSADQDTVWLTANGTTFLTGTYTPNSSNDNLIWSTLNSSSITFNPTTKMVTGGSTTDTLWVLCQGQRSCLTDTVVIIVNPTLSTTPTQQHIAIHTYISPNPFINQLAIQLEAPNDSYTISLTDVMGKQHYTQQYITTQGKQTLMIETAKLPAGYYFLSIQSASVKHVQTIIKQP